MQRWIRLIPLFLLLRTVHQLGHDQGTLVCTPCDAANQRLGTLMGARWEGEAISTSKWWQLVMHSSVPPPHPLSRPSKTGHVELQQPIIIMMVIHKNDANNSYNHKENNHTNNDNTGSRSRLAFARTGPARRSRMAFV